EAEDAVTDDHGDHGVAAAAAPIYRTQCREHVRGCDAHGADTLQLGSEHVQQHLRVGGGVEMAPVLANQDLGELCSVGQIAVVAEADAVGSVDVEGLRLRGAVAAGGWVPDVTEAGLTPSPDHLVPPQHLPPPPPPPAPPP